MHNRNYTEQDAIQRLLLFEEGLSGIIGLMKEEKKDVSKDDMDFLCQSLTQDGNAENVPNIENVME
ncbi:MAG: hypothetical protein ACLRYY_11745 [Anaerobutyricum soehngenii]